MATINLLPRKVFEITLDSGEVITGQYGTWALKRFCDKGGLTLSQAGGRLSAESMSLGDIVDYILCAVEYWSRKGKHGFALTDVDVCDWIDEMGGIQSETFVRLFNHSADEATEEKKTEESL